MLDVHTHTHTRVLPTDCVLDGLHETEATYSGRVVHTTIDVDNKEYTFKVRIKQFIYFACNSSIRSNNIRGQPASKRERDTLVTDTSSEARSRCLFIGRHLHWAKMHEWRANVPVSVRSDSSAPSLALALLPLHTES